MGESWFRCARQLGQRAGEHGGEGILRVSFTLNPAGKLDGLMFKPGDLARASPNNLIWLSKASRVPFRRGTLIPSPAALTCSDDRSGA